MPSVMQTTSLDPGVGRLEDRVGREPRRHEHHRGVRRPSRAPPRRRCRTPGTPSTVLAALAGRHAGHHAGAVVAVAGGVEASLAAGDALHHEPGARGHHDRHQAPPRPARPPARRRPASSAPTTTLAGAASASSLRPSTSLVPSRRTTIGTSHVQPVERRQDAAGDLVAARDAAEHVEQHRPHLGVGQQHLERGHDLVGLRSAADVQEVGRACRRPGRPRRAST